MARTESFSIGIFLIATAPGLAADGPLLDSMDDLRFQAPKVKGRAELVEGKVGRAVRFRFDEDARGVFFTSPLRGKPEWDAAEGFSFWIKGDGTDGFGGLEFVYDDDYAVRYDLCFPVKGNGWRKVEVAWTDLVPVLPGPKAKPLATPGGNLPSRLAGPWIGKWWYWGRYPPLSFAIDEIRLEPTVRHPPAPEVPAGPPLGRVLAKLRAGRPITVVTMGDSLTDKRHWANREVAWVDLLRDKIRAKYGSAVTIVNPSIGGTMLRQNVVLIPTWLDQAPAPDLVTIFFGGNDREAGMRGEEFARACDDAIGRVRRATGGRADVLLITTNPTAARPGETAELAEACRTSARSLHAGLADTEEAFLAVPEAGRGRLYVDDRVHLGRSGHEIVAEAILQAIEATVP